MIKAAPDLQLRFVWPLSFNFQGVNSLLSHNPTSSHEGSNRSYSTSYTFLKSPPLQSDTHKHAIQSWASWAQRQHTGCIHCLGIWFFFAVNCFSCDCVSISCMGLVTLPSRIHILRTFTDNPLLDRTRHTHSRFLAISVWAGHAHVSDAFTHIGPLRATTRWPGFWRRSAVANTAAWLLYLYFRWENAAANGLDVVQHGHLGALKNAAKWP